MVSVVLSGSLGYVYSQEFQVVGWIILFANVRSASRGSGLVAHTAMLPDLSRTKHTILCPICSSEKVGFGGCVVIGLVFLKSSES